MWEHSKEGRFWATTWGTNERHRHHTTKKHSKTTCLKKVLGYVRAVLSCEPLVGQLSQRQLLEGHWTPPHTIHYEESHNQTWIKSRDPQSIQNSHNHRRPFGCTTRGICCAPSKNFSNTQPLWMSYPLWNMWKVKSFYTKPNLCLDMLAIIIN